MSQFDLAERAYIRQSSVSKIESGLRSVSAEDLIYLCYVLDKPISYFYASEFRQPNGPDDFLELEEELLLQARRLTKRDLQQLIAQARAIADFSPPKDKASELSLEEVQQVVDLLGLKLEKKPEQPAKNKSKLPGQHVRKK